ncbi:hypothetical protein B0H16DRAFT_1452339 [Mycena metata]|uniref:Uncharacterized protein n=1 Tax=Mycena metata TaxID=1033252 RepID=A0AAD7JQP2_9AGAR|nr:hypothetical protein B0H16DRAFT_1452339 [Mycena metata]
MQRQSCLLAAALLQLSAAVWLCDVRRCDQSAARLRHFGGTSGNWLRNSCGTMRHSISPDSLKPVTESLATQAPSSSLSTVFSCSARQHSHPAANFSTEDLGNVAPGRRGFRTVPPARCKGGDSVARWQFQLGFNDRKDQIVMVPDPDVPDWKVPGVLWYPARFIKWHEDEARKPKEYEFQWLACTDGTVFNSANSDLPKLIQQMFHRGRQFCDEIAEVKLTAKQIGQIRMPFFMLPDHPHKNQVLAEIFDAAVSPIANILVTFSEDHPVVADCIKNGLQQQQINAKPDQRTVLWMRSLGLIQTAELKFLLEAVLPQLLMHKTLEPLPPAERNQRVLTVGSVLLQLLAVQHALGEPLNLNGDILDDLVVGNVVAFECDGPEALSTMFSLAAPAVSNLAARMLTFNRAHTIYDPDLRPPTFHRVAPAAREPTDAIPVVLKRYPSAEIEDERPGKRLKQKGVKELFGVEQGVTDSGSRQRQCWQRQRHIKIPQRQFAAVVTVKRHFTPALSSPAQERNLGQNSKPKAAVDAPVHCNGRALYNGVVSAVVRIIWCKSTRERIAVNKGQAE